MTLRARFTLAALLAFCGASGSPAAAQEAAGPAAEEECSGLGSQEAEISCLRALLDKHRSAAGESRASAPPAAAPLPPENRFGTEQLDRARPEIAAAGREQAEREERLAANVVETRRDRRGLLVMQLDNGQIWRQDEDFGVPVRVDDARQTPVEISRSGFGGYRMHFPEIGRRMVVSRLK